jgi:hypothetical protein
VLVACTSTAPQAAAQPPLSEVIGSLGAVPLPPSQPAVPLPLPASPGHPQLLAMGAPVTATLPDGATALITTTGPVVRLPPGGARPDAPVTGTLTITAAPSTGTVHLAVADLESRDETGDPITLTPQGPADLTATPTTPATLHLTATFTPGGAQLTWHPTTHPLATWTFTIETD